MIKLDRILCPTDLSTESDEALSYAATLARAYDASCSCCITASRIESAMRKTGVTVLRDGIDKNVPVEEIVPGDICMLNAGETLL
jgi:hypothetical protein